MKKNYYIFVLTFLCFLCGQMGYAQDVYGDEYTEDGNICDPRSAYYDAELCTQLEEVVIINDYTNPDSGDCNDPSSTAYPCEYVDTGDCSDSRSAAYPCDSGDPCDLSSYSFDMCLCDPPSCEEIIPSDLSGCGAVIICSPAADAPYLVANYTTCGCDKLPRPWYLDKDGDGWHEEVDGVKTQIEAPSSLYKKTTSGIDCDDNNILVTNNCYTIYFIDNDGDDWDGGTISAKNDNGGLYKTTTLGPDCDDTPSGGNVHKLNQCGKCEVEPVNGSCEDDDCEQIINGTSLTGEELAGIVGWKKTKRGTTISQIEEIANFINQFAVSFGVNSPEQRYHFYTQIAAETGGLTSLGELPSKEASSALFYKGEGILQLTGRSNFQAFQNYLSTHNYNYDIMTHPELLGENMELAVLSALWYWDKGNNVKQYATDYGDDALLKVSKQVNCGSISSDCGGNPNGYPNGWKHRQTNAKRIKDCINK